MNKASRASALLGGIVWLLLWAVPLSVSDELTMIARLLLFAILVITPLPLMFAATLPHSLLYRIARITQPLAALLAVISFFIHAGILAALFVLPWLLFNSLVGLCGLMRFLSHHFARADELCIDAGFLYLPVGGVWLMLSRLGANPLGFGDTIVLLTAVHFHYAGYAVPILTGLTGRKLAAVAPATQRLFRLVAVGIIAGMALVAAGITLSNVLGSPILEEIAVFVLATSLLGLSYLVLFKIVPTMTHPVARVLLFISGVTPMLTMALAIGYAVGKFTGAWSLTIAQMVAWHGWLNAFGLVLCGLLAWLIVKFEPQDSDRR